MSEAETKHTPFVVGGVYKRNTTVEVVQGMLAGGATKHNGKRTGTMISGGYANERVAENSEALDAWTLVYVPVVAELADGAEAFFFSSEGGHFKPKLNLDELLGLIEDLQREVEELKAAKGAEQVQALKEDDPIPDETTSSKDDEDDDAPVRMPTAPTEAKTVEPVVPLSAAARVRQRRTRKVPSKE